MTPLTPAMTPTTTTTTMRKQTLFDRILARRNIAGGVGTAASTHWLIGKKERPPVFEVDARMPVVGGNRSIGSEDNDGTDALHVEYQRMVQLETVDLGRMSSYSLRSSFLRANSLSLSLSPLNHVTQRTTPHHAPQSLPNPPHYTHPEPTFVQRMRQPYSGCAPPLTVDRLLPVRVHLKTKRNKRCTGCRHILVKCEPKVQLVKHKLKLMARDYMPRCSLRSARRHRGGAATAAAGGSYDKCTVRLWLRNPLDQPLRVEVACLDESLAAEEGTPAWVVGLLQGERGGNGGVRVMVAAGDGGQKKTVVTLGAYNELDDDNDDHDHDHDDDDKVRRKEADGTEYTSNGCMFTIEGRLPSVAATAASDTATDQALLCLRLSFERSQQQLTRPGSAHSESNMEDTMMLEKSATTTPSAAAGVAASAVTTTPVTLWCALPLSF